MHSARVVPDHAAESAMGVCRRIWSEGEVIFFRRVAQSVENDSRLDSRVFLFMIQFENLVVILGKIQDHGKIAALSTEAGPSSARKHRSAVHAAESHGGNRVFYISGNNHSDWNLPVIRSVGRVERAVAVAEAHFALDYLLQRFFQLSRLGEALVFGIGVRTG